MAQLPDKVPPQSPDAEAYVLGCILQSREGVLNAAMGLDLKPEDFYKAAHQLIYKVALEMENAGMSIDLITLPQYLQDRNLLKEVGGRGYLASLTDIVPLASEVEHYLKLILEKSARRQMIHRCFVVASEMYQEDRPLDPELCQSLGVSWSNGKVEEVPDIPTYEFPKPPLDITNPPFLRGFLQDVQTHTYIPPEAALWSIMAGLGTKLADAWTFTQREEDDPRLFPILLANPQSGKSWAMRLVKEKIIPEPHREAANSGEGIYRACEGNFSILIYEEELQEFMARATQEHSSMFPVLRTVFDIRDPLTRRKSAKKDALSTGGCGVSFLAGCTYGMFEKFLSKEIIDDGTASRIWFVPMANPNKKPNTDRRRIKPINIENRLPEILTACEVDWTKPAEALLDKFLDEHQKTNDQDGSPDRLDVYFRRICMILSLCQGHAAHTKETAEWAYAWCHWQREVRKVLPRQHGLTAFAKLEGKVLAAVAKYHPHSLRRYDRGGKPSIYRATSADDYGEGMLTMALDNLVKAGRLIKTSDRPESYRSAFP